MKDSYYFILLLFVETWPSSSDMVSGLMVQISRIESMKAVACCGLKVSMVTLLVRLQAFNLQVFMSNTVGDLGNRILIGLFQSACLGGVSQAPPAFPSTVWRRDAVAHVQLSTGIVMTHNTT